MHLLGNLKRRRKMCPFASMLRLGIRIGKRGSVCFFGYKTSIQKESDVFTGKPKSNQEQEQYDDKSVELEFERNLEEELHRDDEDDREEGSSEEDEIEKAKLVTPGIQNTGGKNGGDNWTFIPGFYKHACLPCKVHLLGNLKRRRKMCPFASMLSWENGSVCFFGYKTSIQKESDVFTGLGSPNPTRSKNNMMINLRNLNLREILKRNSIAIMRMIMRKMELRRPSWLHPESRRQDKREWKESSDEEDGATPKKTPVPKEAKLVTLGIQKTGGKNGGHIAPPAKSDNWRPNTTPRKYVYTPCREDFSTFYDFQYHNKKNHDVSQVIKNDVDSGNPRLTAELSKKRPAEPAAKTPLSKEAKLVTPRIQKTDDKKGGHTAAPCPAMQAAKIPVNSDKSKPQTPKSVGQFSCKSCNKDFNSDGALQSHNKADHNDGEC
ncbi:uncharacterized protein LOC143881850 isoform X10 [Tasmannia lanceolata]|uniref:uncharacterized protein LOC143881850 isoform X10 n=1 Tax=Tasmannia lanceolata TaxID=3420 RepID=UPI0040645620